MKGRVLGGEAPPLGQRRRAGRQIGVVSVYVGVGVVVAVVVAVVCCLFVHFSCVTWSCF